ncbi:MAG TPA: hypothetical protein VM491_05110, partial [Burkholderiaceae bacterium]|nr:hypothetical protein [Burkholderiaceae bacterium]
MNFLADLLRSPPPGAASPTTDASPHPGPSAAALRAAAANGLPPLQLVSDRPRSAARAHTPAHAVVRIGTATIAALESQARECALTLYPMLVAGCAVLLARLSGQRQFAIGIQPPPTAGPASDAS